MNQNFMLLEIIRQSMLTMCDLVKIIVNIFIILAIVTRVIKSLNHELSNKIANGKDKHHSRTDRKQQNNTKVLTQ